MTQRAHVPKFGNWESEDNIPYTVFFDNARKGKTGGKMINPNDPEENPDMFPNIAPQSPAQAPSSGTRNEPEEPVGRRAARPTHERRVSKEDSHLNNDNMGRKAGAGLTHQRGGHGPSAGRPGRSSAGSEHSIERSPLHPHYQAKLAGKGSGSPALEGKNSYDSSHGTPGRSRKKPSARGDDSADKGAAVPRFGQWDENNPSSENYTDIFETLRQERATGSPMVPGTDAKPSYPTTRNQKANDNKGCCFPWFSK